MFPLFIYPLAPWYERPVPNSLSWLDIVVSAVGFWLAVMAIFTAYFSAPKVDLEFTRGTDDGSEVLGVTVINRPISSALLKTFRLYRRSVEVRLLYAVYEQASRRRLTDAISAYLRDEMDSYRSKLHLTASRVGAYTHVIFMGEGKARVFDWEGGIDRYPPLAPGDYEVFVHLECDGDERKVTKSFEVGYDGRLRWLD